jgi:HSP20 family molecular chaperone IbpA
MVHAEVPGLTWRDLRVNLHRNELVLEGERRPDSGAELDVVRREGAYGRFCRCVPFEVEVEPREMRVRLRDGILCLEVPIAAPMGTAAAVS